MPSINSTSCKAVDKTEEDWGSYLHKTRNYLPSFLRCLVSERVLAILLRARVFECIAVLVYVTHACARAISFVIMHVPSTDLPVERSSPAIAILITFDFTHIHTRNNTTTEISGRENERSSRSISKNWTEMIEDWSSNRSWCLSISSARAILHVFHARCYSTYRGKLSDIEKKEVIVASTLCSIYPKFNERKRDGGKRERKGSRCQRLARGMKPDLGLRSRNLPRDPPGWPPRTRFAFQCPSEYDPRPLPLLPFLYLFDVPRPMSPCPWTPTSATLYQHRVGNASGILKSPSSVIAGYVITKKNQLNCDRERTEQRDNTNEIRFSPLRSTLFDIIWRSKSRINRGEI